LDPAFERVEDGLSCDVPVHAFELDPEPLELVGRNGHPFQMPDEATSADFDSRVQPVVVVLRLGTFASSNTNQNAFARSSDLDLNWFPIHAAIMPDDPPTNAIYPSGNGTSGCLTQHPRR
jgi:hypothetical protein